MNNIHLRINVLESFETLIKALQSFCARLNDDADLPLWLSRTEEETEARADMRQKAVRLYRSLWYEDGQDGRETVTCPGLIGVSRDTLETARECNAAKDGFKQAVLQLKQLAKTDVDRLLEQLNQVHRRDPQVAQAMQRMGAARINLKQAYRHIPLLERRPLKVGFTWSRQGRTIQRIDIAEARRLLERRGETPQIRAELDRLSRLPAHELLARARPVCPHLRANVVFGDDAEQRRRLVQTPLPLLVPLEPGQSLPAFVPVPPQPVGADRLRRSDIKLEDEPFLVSLQVYRYRKRYRDTIDDDIRS